jgi:hypothetical protein
MEFSIKGPYGMFSVIGPSVQAFCSTVVWLSRGEDHVWGVVKDAVSRHKKFEKRNVEAIQSDSAPKRSRTGFFNAFHEFIEGRPPMSSIADSNHELYTAIDAYRKLPGLSQEADLLGFWRDNSTSSLLQPLVPLAVSVSAVTVTEAI